MTEQVLEALRDAINSHEPQQVAACFTDDYALERPLRPHESFVGNEKVQQTWTGMFGQLPDLRAEILRSVRDGEEIWSEWEMRGTNPKNEPTLLRGPVIVTERDGRINWARFYLDPVSHAGQTSITVSEVVEAAADTVFELLADPSRHREIDASGTIRGHKTDNAITAVGDSFVMAMHNDMFGDYIIENHVVVCEPGRAVGWAPGRPGERPLGHRYVWRLEPLGDNRTKVTQTYDWSAITDAPAIPHLPVRSEDELTESIRLIGPALT
ncbi:SnoaL-like domain-containing protein [Streptomyces sp. HC44]|uniref:SnoaL-like domain-containing protein n=1 Tax=Streptomyces scabichelini TaxID=2711217 RepID=A0A6G4VKH6_9ACTN|nr:nuclear transport factor 2 family protein [Streptomyces scabichelini]NGO14606.1 SnoaL-like domain-containing protein [Streptomyces scabichelini]